MGAADDRNFTGGKTCRFFIRECKRGFERSHYLGVVEAIERIAGDDNIRAIGKRPAQRLVGLAPHDDRLADGFFLKLLEIARNLPRQIAVLAHHSVFGNGDDEGDFRSGAHFLRNLSRLTTSAPIVLSGAAFAALSADADAFFFPRGADDVAGRSSGSEA